MKKYRFPTTDEYSQILKRCATARPDILSQVAEILSYVRRDGDSALRDLTLRFDKVDVKPSAIPQELRSSALATLDPGLRVAIETAIGNVKKFHALQLPTKTTVEVQPGIYCERVVRPIERVGLYIPGGSAPLFSTLIMLAVPALLAGVRQISVLTPPEKNSKFIVNQVVLAVAEILGISCVHPVGGAQAIAALAYGTENISRVDKIYGPGNSYVDLAKQLVAKCQDCKVAIDLPAGPSEVCVIADDSATAKFVAADLLAQSEHGPDSHVILLTTNETLYDSLEREIAIQLNYLPRSEICRQCLEHSSAVLLTDICEAIELANQYAPEHLILAVKDADSLVDKVTSAGSVFVGELSAESFGDYASGTNHVLPTGGWAKVFGGVSVSSFQKWISVQKITQKGVESLAPIVAKLARAEGLEAHAKAAEIRMKI